MPDRLKCTVGKKVSAPLKHTKNMNPVSCIPTYSRQYHVEMLHSFIFYRSVGVLYFFGATVHRLHVSTFEKKSVTKWILHEIHSKVHLSLCSRLKLGRIYSIYSSTSWRLTSRGFSPLTLSWTKRHQRRNGRETWPLKQVSCRWGLQRLALVTKAGKYGTPWNLKFYLCFPQHFVGRRPLLA